MTKEGTPKVEVESLDLGALTELDLSTLDSAYVYRWARKIPIKITRWRAKGYEIVRPEEDDGIKNVVGDSPETEDGTYTIGDLVLMRINKAEHRARRKAIARKNSQRLKGPERKFRKEADAVARQRGIDIEVTTDYDEKGG